MLAEGLSDSKYKFPKKFHILNNISGIGKHHYKILIIRQRKHHANANPGLLQAKNYNKELRSLFSIRNSEVLFSFAYHIIVFLINDGIP